MALTDREVEDLLVGQHPCSSMHEGDASRFLADRMRAHGFDDAFVDESDSAVGIIGSGSREVVLLGHIDTFGGNFPVRRDGRLLYGRGSVVPKVRWRRSRRRRRRHG
ncbi:MAG: hypothetical protein U0703_04765 [Anaerolineae bacterium]